MVRCLPSILADKYWSGYDKRLSKASVLGAFFHILQSKSLKELSSSLFWQKAFKQNKIGNVL